MPLIAKQKKTYSQQSPKSIQELFNLIANRYDQVNSIMSFGLHHVWNKQLVKRSLKIANQPEFCLDLCCGTGAISHILKKQAPYIKQFSLLDFSSEMLHIAEKKFQEDPRFIFFQEDACDLPFPSKSFHLITVAYGIRNVESTYDCFSEAYRVLKKSACLAILELTCPSSFILQNLHAFHLKYIVPQIGRFVTTQKTAYKYLSSSIQDFVSPSYLTNQLQQVGFTEHHVIPLTGGIATLILAKK